MRKILISILIILLLVVGYMVMFRGLEVLGMNVLSITQIQDKNAELDRKLETVSVLTSIEQPKAMSELNDSAKELTIAKDEYNEKILSSSSENIALATQVRPYETEYLWTRLGNHAKDKGINLRYELKQASSGITGQYDIYFTVTGSYVSISEFISALENDSSLSFKIENFKMSPNGGNTENLQSTFTVKDIIVKLDSTTGSTTATNATTTNTTTANTVE